MKIIWCRVWAKGGYTKHLVIKNRQLISAKKASTVKSSVITECKHGHVRLCMPECKTMSE